MEEALPEEGEGDLLHVRQNLLAVEVGLAPEMEGLATIKEKGKLDWLVHLHSKVL